VLDCRLANLDDETGRALPEIFAPGIFAENAQSLGNGFIETLRADLNGMLDAAPCLWFGHKTHQIVEPSFPQMTLNTLPETSRCPRVASCAGRRGAWSRYWRVRATPEPGDIGGIVRRIGGVHRMIMFRPLGVV
jgi:hypothetical protein